MFDNLIDLTAYFSDKRNCINYLKDVFWNGSITCPFCNHNKVYELKGQFKRYKCSRRDCAKHFSLLKGTIFENTKISLQKWLVAYHFVSAHKKGISSIQLGKDIGVTQKTAWFMLQRIRTTWKIKALNRSTGIFQCDEVYIGGKNKNRVGDRKLKNSQGRSLQDKTPVFGILSHTGQVHTTVIPNTKAKTIEPIIKQMVEHGSIVVTDEWLAYNKLSDTYYHIALKHNEKEFVRGAFHTNSIEGYWSLFKRGIFGIYHWASAKHLQRYCDEFAFRYNLRQLTPGKIFDIAVQKAKGFRLTYRELIGEKKGDQTDKTEKALHI